MSPGFDPAAALAGIAGTRVLVLGDVMLDRYLSGRVERISPEAPVPVLRIDAESSMLGGAGNVLRNLTALGAKADLVALVGDDSAGDEVARLLVEAGGGDFLMRLAGRPTSIKERYLASGQQLLRSDRDPLETIPPDTAEALAASAEALLPEASALVLSDYGKGLLSEAVIGQVLVKAKALGLPVVVDPKGQDFSRYAGASLITPNRRELEEAVGLPTASDAEVEAACQRLLEETAIGAVLATRGADGMTLAQAAAGADPAFHHLPTMAREVFDVSGAGDSVVATMAAALAAGLPALEAAGLANAAAGLVVAKVGTAVVRSSEVLQAFHAMELSAAEDKVADGDALLEKVARWRRRGLRVGFTNGCFDLLHPGHVALLRQARDACDRLVVGLNSDASVERLKGTGRPIQGEAARAAVLASMASVDSVVVFGEDTPLQLIGALKPDVLIKGADYRIDQVVGADLVQDYGGQVLLIPIEEGHSTTATIGKMSNRAKVPSPDR